MMSGQCLYLCFIAEMGEGGLKKNVKVQRVVQNICHSKGRGGGQKKVPFYQDECAGR